MIVQIYIFVLLFADFTYFTLHIEILYKLSDDINRYVKILNTSCLILINSYVILKFQNQPPTVAVLKLRKPHVAKKVEWSNDTVDNENMNKKKSKCRFIFYY